MSWTFLLLTLFTEHAHFYRNCSSSANIKMTFNVAWHSISGYRNGWESLDVDRLRENLRNQ